jgi:hypothetical protein
VSSLDVTYRDAILIAECGPFPQVIFLELSPVALIQTGDSLHLASE